MGQHDPGAAIEGRERGIATGPMQEALIYVSLTQAAKRIPSFRGERPTHVATVTRWITIGVRMLDGSRLRLRADRLPGRWATTAGWLDEFIAAITADRAGDVAQAPPIQVDRRGQSKAAERADAELSAAGF